jgi:UDP-N-acetylmuramate--alanine ligase
MKQKLDNIKNVYFLGIGGIGMSAIARWFLREGYWVGGYDRSKTELTQQLEQEGMAIHYQEDTALIPDIILQSQITETLVIWTPAVPATHAEYLFLNSKGYLIQKRAEVLGWLTENYKTIAVAGTHGKTTTSSMIGHILQNSPLSCTAFLGGILQNYDSNLLLSSVEGRNQLMVVEADEYDRSFLHLSPWMAVVTSMDADHLDIYGDKSEMTASYQAFVAKIQAQGKLFAKKGLDLVPSQVGVNLESYSTIEEADYQALNIKIEGGNFYFDWKSAGELIENIALQVQGFHNVENATVAIAVCRALGVSAEVIKESLASFRGAKRRFEYYINSPDMVLIDDYAHHPAEVEAFLRSVKAIYPAKKITAIFQPHLYSRTRDFADEFAESLSLADELFLLDIYPAREVPIEGVSSQLILDKVHIPQKKLISKHDLLELFHTRGFEVVVMMGAGDIVDLIPEVKEILIKDQR